MKPIIKVLLVLVPVVIGIAWAQNGNSHAVAPPSQPSLTPKYQIVFGPHARADTYLLDTQTGKIWMRTAITDIEGDPEVWVLQQRFDNEAEKLVWANTQTFKTKAP